jgi:hypothetical protein
MTYGPEIIRAHAAAVVFRADLRLEVRSRAAARNAQRWSGKMPTCPKLIVPLQIDLAMELGRYLLSRSANPRARDRHAATLPVRAIRRRHGLPPEALVQGRGAES